uniref:Pentacotripeptide-repeat region of PRORP domain-containing protein n=1 Tax=Brassica oleracea var. oleracea TaxID=109376 RepID=A0A0D2ZPW3_BRAOL
MMRILAQHAKHYRIRTFRTLSSWANQTLQHRLTEALDQNAKIIPVLQQWRQQGNQIDPSHVRVIIKKLRDSDQSLQALQVSEWMSKEKICSLTPEDFAARFCLIDNVVGLEEAETFFESIPNSARDESVYTSLLSSYTRSDKTMSKAEATFKTMRELGLLTSPSPYNAMISLYSALKNRDKVDELLREMQAGKIEEVLRIWNLYMRSTEQCDNNDYLKVIRLLLKLDDIFGAEEIYKVWESLPLEFDIRIPTTLASGYRKRGMVDEADKLMNSRIIKYRRMNKPINPLLDQWGSRMRMSELKCLIKNLHDSNQFSKALQVSEWMDEKRACSFYPEDYAARLHMVEVVLGKAMETFEKMRELGFLMKPSPFNSMLSFHTQENMVEELLREMEENNVAPDSLMVNKVLRIYAAETNVEAMETFMKMWSG